ncbi:MAG TPA: hypothetical protein VIN61_09765 [Gammaproteobacteria bacterium]
MKAAFILSVIVGFAGVLAGAHFYPWVQHVRLPSRTSVVANGGRAEEFVIRLPADRVHGAGTAAAGLRGEARPAAARLPADLADGALLVEHFKVRDTGGQVIGVAARHWTDTPDGWAAAWALMIPGRGTLYLTGRGEGAARVDAALARAGFARGTPWSGELTVDLLDEGAGRVVGGSDEFERLVGTYGERWTVTSVAADGELAGTITLSTVTRAGS